MPAAPALVIDKFPFSLKTLPTIKIPSAPVFVISKSPDSKFNTCPELETSIPVPELSTFKVPFAF